MRSFISAKNLLVSSSFSSFASKASKRYSTMADTGFDIMVIGGGPGGLGAVSSIVRQNYKTVVFDSGKYRNAISHHMHTVPTWDHKDPAEFRVSAQKDFERYGCVTVEKVEIETIKQRDDGLFEASGDGRTWTAKKVVLATGVEDVFPDIPGYADCWGTGIFHCLYCHGWEQKGVPRAAMFAVGETSIVLTALFLARQVLRMTDKMTIYTNGNEQLAKDLDAAIAAAPAPMTVDPRPIAKLVKGAKAAEVEVHFADGDSQTEGFIAHKPKTQLRGTLAQQLGLELTPKGVLELKPPFNQTSLRGVFAAGDCSSPMQIINSAIYSGTLAGGGAPVQIQAEEWKQPPLF